MSIFYIEYCINYGGYDTSNTTVGYANSRQDAQQIIEVLKIQDSLKVKAYCEYEELREIYPDNESQILIDLSKKYGIEIDSFENGCDDSGEYFIYEANDLSKLLRYAALI